MIDQILSCGAGPSDVGFSGLLSSVLQPFESFSGVVHITCESHHIVILTVLLLTGNFFVLHVSFNQF